jgi:hypothetical protein
MPIMTLPPRPEATKWTTGLNFDTLRPLRAVARRQQMCAEYDLSARSLCQPPATTGVAARPLGVAP